MFANSIDGLISVLEDNGLPIKNEEDKKDLYECLKEDRFQFFIEEDELKGFLTWIPIWRDGKLWVWVNNGCKWGNGNFLKLRSFFRKKYPNVHRFFWFSKKKNKYCYVK